MVGRECRKYSVENTRIMLNLPITNLSIHDHWEYSSGEVYTLAFSGVQRAAMCAPGEIPLIVHPLGVAVQGVKRRLICDARYLNLFLGLIPFQYERLRDILAYTFGGSFMGTWDLKSGYYHILFHKDYRKYIGFKVGNQYFVYNVPCFGLSQACYLFIKVMQEPMIELRQRSIPISAISTTATRLPKLMSDAFVKSRASSLSSPCPPWVPTSAFQSVFYSPFSALLGSALKWIHSPAPSGSHRQKSAKSKPSW